MTDNPIDTLQPSIVPTDKDGQDFVLDVEPYNEEQRRECLLAYIECGFDVMDTVRAVAAKYREKWGRSPSHHTINRWVSSANKSILKRGLISKTHKVLNKALTNREVEMKDALKAVQLVQEHVEGKPAQQLVAELTLNVEDYNALMNKSPKPKQGNGEWETPKENS
jgi:hypothetical protein